MKLGFFTMPLHPPGSLQADTLASDLEQVETLDRLGYEEAWFGEHFTSEWENLPCPDLFIAAAISRTKRIKLGTGVVCMPSHNPFQLAHRVAVLDHLARGRFLLGVGAGGYPGDFEAFHVDASGGAQRELTRDAIDLVLQLWKDPQPGNYVSKRWDFTVPAPREAIGQRFHVKPFQQPHPPIGLAGVSPNSETLVLAGERGWIPMSINLASPAVLQTHWQAVERGAAKTGQTTDRFQWRIAREVFVADTTEEARQEALHGVLARDFNDYFLPLVHTLGIAKLMKHDANLPDAAITVPYLVDNLWLVGSPEDVALQIRQLYKTVGGFGVLLAMGHEWLPQDKWQHSMDLLANRVLPLVADLR